MMVAGGRRWPRALVSVLAGLLIAAAVVQASGFSAPAAGAALLFGATGIRAGAATGGIGSHLGALRLSFDALRLAGSLARATPLLFIGVAVALALRAGLFNIGAQGQMILGGLAAGVAGAAASRLTGSAASSWVIIPLLAGAGMAAGGIWGALAGVLKAYRGVHEVISTILLNYVAADMASYLVTHGLRDPDSMAIQTATVARGAWLTPLVPSSGLTAGLLVAILATVAYAAGLRFTPLGFRMRAVGANAQAARAAGVPVERVQVLTLALSGALAGLAGAVQVMAVHHRYVDGIAGYSGFDGIAVALLGALGPWGVALSAAFFGGLANGAAVMELRTDVPAAIAAVVQAVAILFACARFAGWSFRRAPQDSALTVSSEASGAAHG